MNSAVAAQAAQVRSPESTRDLRRQLLWLAMPVLAEQFLHMLVGFNDTYLANHLTTDTRALSSAALEDARNTMAAAAAAVGTISYILWLIGMLTAAIGTGSTAIIARATGARHRSLANSVCGQSMSAGAIGGLGIGAIMYFFASPLASITGLTGQGHDFALVYLRMLAWCVPFLTMMFVANACLRGAGDTKTPAIAFIIVDIVNIVLSWGLTYGVAGMPKMGFEGIVIGTVIAYILGGLIQIVVLIHGRGGIRLHLHRLAPHWHNLRRLLRIGLPSGVEGMLQWGANAVIVVLINRLDTTLVSSAAHNNTIKIESISYLTGFAFATAAATMVGQSLGMHDSHRAARCGRLAFLLGGGFMTLMGLIFILFGRIPAMVLSEDPRVIELTRQCLFVTGWFQIAFASAMIFGGALRGAGDTFKVMLLSLASIFALRLAGSLVVALAFHRGLVAIWIVLSAELLVRGSLIFLRFASGAWKHARI